MELRESKKLNLVLFNVEESNAIAKDDSAEDDKVKLSQIQEELNTSANFSNFTRLGAKSQNKTRPLKGYDTFREGGVEEAGDGKKRKTGRLRHETRRSEMDNLQGRSHQRKSRRPPEEIGKRGIEEKNKKKDDVNSVNKLRCFYTNSDSLMNKRIELQAVIVSDCPDIICITEFAPKNTSTPIQEVELQIEGYDMFSNINKLKRGVLIYTRKNLKPTLSTAEDVWESNEACWCEIKLKDGDKLLIGCIYRSPNSVDTNNDKMMNNIKEICEKTAYTHLLVCGDFNIPEIDWIEEVSQTTPNHLAFKFLECIRDCYLCQHVKSPTHSRRNQAEHILDLVLTNEDGMIEDIQYDAPLGKSDHLVLKFNFLCYSENKEEIASKLLYHKGNYKQMNEELASHSWEEELKHMNIEESWNLLESRILEAVKRNIPRSKTNLKQNRKPIWMNSKVFTKLKKKTSAFKRYMKSKEGEDNQAYAKLRNQAKWACRTAVRDLEKNIANESKINPKAFYNYARNTSSIPDFPQHEIAEEMKSLKVTEEMVLKKLKKLNPNRSGGMDGIIPRVLLECAESILTPVTALMNKTLEEGVLPQRWKDAEVTPIYKKGKKSIPGNYRPISLTSVLCKTTESIIRDHIMDYLYNNKLLTDCQHGFVRRRSCITQLLECLDVWTEILDSGGNVDVVYMDYAKAFDKVAHIRLLKKLQGYGLTKQILDWIRSFLNGRRQRVKVNGEVSRWADVLSGVPQGSVLGPVLFVCYINDLPDEIHTHVKLFANDTKVYADVSKSISSQELQGDITRLDEWARKWQLAFNSSKCKVMHMGNKNPQQSYYMEVATKQ
eukprot:gene16301-17938_t